MGILRETIRPSSDLRNKYPEISKTLQLKDEAAIITVNGRGDTVSLGYNTYNMLKSKNRIIILSCRRTKRYHSRSHHYT